MNIKKLKLARNRVDSIDKKIFNLIKKRTKIVNYMMIIKKKKNQIIDRKRINIILKNIRKKSLINRIDPNITLKIWKAMIWSYIDYQKNYFKKK